MEPVRLQKFLAEAGIASRRKAEEIIQSGRVLVNHEIVTALGTKVTENDQVEVDGKIIQSKQEKIYIMLNKPIGFVTTAQDQFARPTVLDLVKDIKERIYPIGRLDYDTSGLLLLTNDGEFTFRLTHPKHEVEKVYLVEVEGVPDEEDIRMFEQGFELEGKLTSTAGLEILEKKPHTSMVKITIHEGRNRQVRKMCEMIHHSVCTLKRVSIGNVTLEDLPSGQWRFLKEDEKKWLGSL